VLIGGSLLVRKLHRFDLVVTFVLVTIATVLATTAPADYGMALRETLLSSPMFFFAFVMLTEPITAPTMPLPSIAFGALVGFLFAPNVHIGSIYFTPELALLIGNLFAFAVGPRGRLLLTLERIEQSAADTYDFVFRPHRRPAFHAGQYLEWTLGIPQTDRRGNRRYFTVASAPGEETIRLGVKFHREPSAFKRALGAMVPGDTIYAGQLAGSFTLPSDPKRKLAFLAGGIGITPFRSMIQHLLDCGEARPIIVLYGNETQHDIAYRHVFDTADRELGIRTVYAVARDAARHQYPGFIDANLVRQAIPDYRDRTFYISGPQAMVKKHRAMLRSMGVRPSRIKVDFFPGFG
jgi:ferredoxin-NADP reductase